MPGATLYTALPSPMPLHRGGELSAGVIAYETWGTLNSARDNAIMIVTGMSPSAHAASSALDPTPGWWEPMIGRDRSFDTERYFIVDVASSEVTRHASSMQAYTDVQYRELLAACGGEDVTFYPSLGGVPAAGLLAITARRALGTSALSPGEGA